MFVLELTAEETQTFQKANCVYCIRGEVVYLVERENGKVKTTIFNAPVTVYAVENKSLNTAIRL